MNDSAQSALKTIKNNQPKNEKKIDWVIATFLVTVAFISVTVVPFYLYFYGLPTGLIIFTVLSIFFTNLSITAGYHRYFSHRSYNAHPLVEWLFLLFGASAFQASVLKWGSDHRRHHIKVDTDDDPYSINKGFWFAHMEWLFYEHHEPIKAPDLEKNPRVMFQHKYYVPLAILTGFGLPTLVGYFLGSAMGGFLVGGFFRIAFTQQVTFLVNSLCHTLGRQTYSDQVSARDSWFVAFLTNGEGYHNFHHTFQSDYRNGIKWYQWDPTKWTIQSLRIFSLTSDLKEVASTEILKAKMHMEELYMRRHGFSVEKLEQLKKQVHQAQLQVKQLRTEYQNLKREFSKNSHAKIKQLKHELKIAKIELRHAMKLWGSYAKVYAQSI